MHLTIAYMTCRKEPKLEWFLDSLNNEIKAANCEAPKLVIVTYHRSEFNWPKRFAYAGEINVVEPKPTVWQGPHRLTTQDYFAPANARNTAICHAPDGYIAFVDDLSVLLHGWLNAVREAMAGNYIVLGAYKKVKNLVAENGEVKSFEEFPSGIDSRWSSGRDDKPVHAAGSWLFGCSFAAPVEALLKVNGLDENCDSCGGEDYNLGIRLQNAGYSFKYDRRMLTYESEELHHAEKPMIRLDKGKSPHDKSHALLKMAQGSSYAANYFGEGGIRALRAKILAGEPFPVTQIPQHDFFDGQPLSEM